jgi:hypothetical protein
MNGVIELTPGEADVCKRAAHGDAAARRELGMYGLRMLFRLALTGDKKASRYLNKRCPGWREEIAPAVFLDDENNEPEPA